MDAGILVYDGADELDVVGPFRVLHAANEVRPYVKDAPLWHVHVIGETSAPMTLSNGLIVTPTASFSDAPDLDVVVVPGGGGERTDRGRHHEEHHAPTLAWLQQRRPTANVIAGVGTGVFVLAAAGLVDGRRVNTHWQDRDALVRFMAERGARVQVVGSRVVDDGDLVTAGGLAAGIDLGLELVDRYGGADQCRGVELVLEIETPGEADLAPPL